MAMQYRVLSVDGAKVRVRFFDPDADFIHTREVNACTTAAGEYDREATRERIKAILSGVEAKVAAGAINDDREAKRKS